MKHFLLALWHAPVIQKLIPTKLFYQIRYYRCTGRWINIDKPETFNEKIQWLKLYNRNPEYKMMTDKYQVRTYIAEMIGPEYLVPQYGVYKDFDEIDFDILPNQFVLKPNHTSGDVFICRDKSQIDFVQLEERVNRWLKRDFYQVEREWPYRGISPVILCEKLLVDESGADLKDYKFMCFRGEVKGVFVCSERKSKTGLKVDYYDLDWNLAPFERHYPKSGKANTKPEHFSKMVEFASLLSNEHPFLRVDFYEVERQLYFGELTFYPGSGFEEFSSHEVDIEFGEYLVLPEKVQMI